jgi:uncharacterized protein (TIGR02231 family)
MYWKPSILVVSALLLLPVAGHAATEVPGEGAITAVTVFPGRAEVTRTVEISLPAGESTVVVGDLPASLYPDSVRVVGEADRLLLIGSVETRKEFAEAAVREEERRLIAEIEALRDRRKALDDQVAAARIQLEFLKAIGRDAPRTATQELGQGRLDPEAWRQAIALIGEGAAKALDQVRTAEIDKRALERKIAQTERRLNLVRTGRTASLSARVNVQTERPTSARLVLTYQLPGASWRPLYDARLESETGTTRLVQIGEVRQGTGEDWSNVRLTLSTARPALSGRLPELGPWFVDFAYVANYKRLERGAESELRDLNEGMAKSAPVGQSRDAIAGGAGAPATEPALAITAQVVAGEFAAEYAIPGEATVPSDKAPHKFVITEADYEMRLAVRTVPKIAPRAYLYGEVTYEGEAPLLPGPISVFRDGSFIGTSAMGMLRPGQDFKLSFGVDNKVRVSYRLETGKRSREGLINKDRRVERRYIIKVANHHKRPMDITVLDQLPVAQDERIEVQLLRTSTSPDERDVDDRKGVLAWRGTYEPGEERTIKFAYAVTFPDGQAVPGF